MKKKIEGPATPPAVNELIKQARETRGVFSDARTNVRFALHNVLKAVEEELKAAEAYKAITQRIINEGNLQAHNYWAVENYSTCQHIRQVECLSQVLKHRLDVS